MVMMPLMRMMLSVSIMVNPSMNRVIFLGIEPVTMKSMKTANIRKAVREYIPEHARSTVKVAGCPAVEVRIIAGGPYCVDRVTGSPRVFSSWYDASVLMFPRMLPAVNVNSAGGGVRKSRNRIGKISVVSVLRLKRISVMPMAKIGREKRWYSSG